MHSAFGAVCVPIVVRQVIGVVVLQDTESLTNSFREILPRSLWPVGLLQGPLDL